nr:hypothetical protein [Gammaproteobacteria bacterium]NIX59306.1 hypothetical protein [candidate division Zixibacteria bacterium]
YQVWLEDWEVRQIAGGRYQLTAQQDHIALSLTLVDEKGPVLQGDGGYSQKGPHPGNASYYYSQPRLRSTGTITLGEEMFEVSGWSWKDHEFSTGALSDDKIGWDWFSLQLDDGTDLMLYSFRREDGSMDPYSSGAIIYTDGKISLLAPDEFTITTLDRWVSPESSAEYPSKWRIQIPSAQIDLTITPYLSNQELLVTVIYWEGAVQAEGTHGNNEVNGAGYVELTGYFQSMKSWF